MATFSGYEADVQLQELSVMLVSLIFLVTERRRKLIPQDDNIV